MSYIIRPEVTHAINGVQGRLNILRRPPAPWKPGTFGNQTWKSVSRPVRGYGANGKMTVDIRFDDNCRNGHNSFAITAAVITAESLRRSDIQAGGRLHDDIARVFPELAPLIKWHLCSTDGPMHYVANTICHAGDRDHNRLRKGERRQIIGRDGLPCWELVAVNAPGILSKYYASDPKYAQSETVNLRALNTDARGADAPETAPTLVWAPSCFIGEGKPRNLEAARSCAVWPDATDEQLCAEPEALKAALEARLPGLLTDFRQDMENAGFMWACPPDGV